MPGKDAIYCPCPPSGHRAPAPSPDHHVEPQKSGEAQGNYKQKKMQKKQ